MVQKYYIYNTSDIGYIDEEWLNDNSEIKDEISIDEGKELLKIDEEELKKV